MIYYNEFNPESAAMIRQFMTDGLIPNGIVDERSITEIDPDELKRYTQCHFFAGIAGWTFALQIAGWPTDRPVWTGSCPCQPFSTAGKQKGKADERHLWPVWFRLIRECRPASVYGEQVAAAVTHEWLDEVATDLESEDYAFGSAIIPACGVGAPHKRDRLWFVADSRSERIYNKRPPEDTRPKSALQNHTREQWVRTNAREYDECIFDVGDTQHTRPHGEQVAGSDTTAICDNTQRQDSTSEFKGASEPCNVANTEGILLQGCQNRPWQGEPWGNSAWIQCPDGKQRLVEPSIRLLVDGFQHRKPILHALGNAIVPQVAAKFIEATM